MLMHCGDTIFTYDNAFKEYMKVEGAILEDILDYLIHVGAENFYQKKERNIFWNYLRNGIQSIFN